MAARVEGASQDPTPDLLITGHPVATAALSPTLAAARSVFCLLSSFLPRLQFFYIFGMNLVNAFHQVT